ncbi:MAG: hypothetical protein DRO99_00380 [Candidatus Aenigmatarchaeota archaeon]|nr:MAG: hypothetical protein DRO99_00380 [Candidatus Aenigmarchaeota archaeon]
MMSGKKSFYKRGWHHTKGRGNESMVTCSFCGKRVPKYKTFSVVKGFRISDTVLRQMGGRRGMPAFMQNKARACPACARHRNIVRRKK